MFEFSDICFCYARNGPKRRPGTYVTGQPASHTNATDETSAAADETSAAANETPSRVFLPYWALLP
jgi:hypothetical protein